MGGLFRQRNQSERLSESFAQRTSIGGPRLTIVVLGFTIMAMWPVFVSPLWAADEADLEPILRVDTGGPTSYVTSLIYARDGQTLYAAGWDKIVRAWTRRNGRFVANPAHSIRVPLGPRLAGAINAVAVSPDGRLIAVAGRGLIDGETGFRQQGISLLRKGSLTPRMQLDQGVIYLFDTQTRQFQTLRGHRGPVLSLAFDTDPNHPLTLASAAFEPVPRTNKKQAAVRLWDVSSRKYLRGTFLNVADAELRKPDLAIWRTGEAPTDCRVAIAWNDGNLNIWDTRGKTQPQQLRDGSFNNAVITLPGGKRLLTASFTNTGGRLRLWESGETVRPVAGGDISLTSPSPQQYFVPRAIDVHQRRNGPMVAAVAVQVVDASGTPTSVELQLYELTSRRRLFRQELWKMTGQAVKRPSVAFAPDGQSLAVAGAPDHGVRVLMTSDVFQNQYHPELLLSESTELGTSYFVRRNESRGIYFVESGTNRPLVFDLSRRVIVPFQANLGWTYDRIKADGWTLTGSDNHVVVKSPSNQTTTIKANTEALREITAFAVLPANKLRPKPIIALASQEYGQPTLALHDLTNGEPFRVLYGHTERIEHLSFSGDGRLLLSSGADQTVRVWSMIDIDATLDRNGELMGVAVDDDDDNEGVIVADVEETSPHQNQLRPGEHILGIEKDGQLELIDFARQLYLELRKFTPGSRVTLQVSSNGQTRNVALVVNQAIDERKPLFSLLVMRAQPRLDVRRWIAWSPAGPFESSDETIEQYLGWHFNTGDPDRPTSFADLNQYRDEYYREGLLHDLLTFGKLTARRAAEPIAPPSMSLMVAELGVDPPIADNQVLIQDTSQLTLSLNMGFGVSPAAIESIECSLDENRLGLMRRVGDLRWDLDLSNTGLARGEHRIEAMVRTNEVPAQVFTKQLVVRYQPPPPALSLVSPQLLRAHHVTVQSEQFQLEAEATPTANTPTLLRLYRRIGKQREELRTWNVNERQTIEQSLSLVEGTNDFILEAKNSDAGGDDAWLETTVRSFSITRSPEEREPIQLAVNLATTAKQLNNVLSDQQLQIRNNSFVLRGSISGRASANLTVVTTEGDATNQLTPEVTKTDSSIDFRAEVSGLSMDAPTQVAVVAQAEDGTTTRWQIVVTYLPPLPTVEFVAPIDRVFFSDAETQTANVAVRLMIPDDVSLPDSVLQQLQVRFIANDDDAVVGIIDLEQATATGQISLRRGVNRVRAELNYAGRAVDDQETSEPVLLTLNQPPRLEDVSLLPIDGQPRAKLLFTGKSQTELPTVRIGPFEVSPDDVIYNRETERFEGQVTVPVDEGNNLPDDLQVEIRPRGTRRTFALNIERPATTTAEKAPPTLEYVTPESVDSTAKSQYIIALEARSQSPFTRFQILRDGQRLVTVEGADLQQQVERDGDEFLLRFESNITLNVGPNELIAVVHNVHSGEKQSATITRVPPLVRVVVDEYSTEDRRSINVETGQVDSPIANVHGRVVWRDADDPRLKKRMFVKLRINGFQQIAELEPPHTATERRFSVPVLFAETQNRIDISLADVERLSDVQRDVGDFEPVFVECVKPQGLYRLHVLVIGVGNEVAGDTMMNQALEVFRAKREQASNKISTPIYAQGWVYGALTGSNARYRTVASRLEKINQRILFDRPRDTRVRDVVMLYYTGGELVPKEHTFYLTTRPNQSAESLRRNGISSKMLTGFVESTPGAHVLMLDVSRDCDGQCPRATWPLRSPGAMLRFAWIGVNQKPADFGLLSSLNQIDAQNERLGQVETELQQQEASILQRFSNALVYENFVPDALRNLKLRAAD